MNFFRRKLWEQGMDEELRFHMEAYVEDLVGAGVERREAERRARLKFGGMEAVKDECREAWGWRRLDELGADLRYTLRTFSRSPGFTAVAVLSLALGIGANTAVFSMVDAVMLRMLPVKDPGRLVFIENAGSKGGNGAPPYPCFEQMRDTARGFTAMAAFSPTDMVPVIDGQRELAHGQFVSGNYYDVLGVKALVGRTLTAADDRVIGKGGGDGPVAVISYGYWQSRFGGANVIGRPIRVNESTVTIVGVMPPYFSTLDPGKSIDLTLPMALSDPVMLKERHSWWMYIVGRLADGVSSEQARAEMDSVFQAYMADATMPADIRGEYFQRIELPPAGRGLGGVRERFSKPLAIMMAIVALVLLTACANIASLMLARATARRKEFAVRLALGASRGRVVRQTLTEAGAIMAAGSLLGLALARWGGMAMAGLLAEGQRGVALDLGLNLRVLLFTLAVAALTAVLFGIAPAIRGAQVDPASGLHASSRSSTGSRNNLRLGRLLVIAQVTLSTILLASAGLFVRSLWNLRTLAPGFTQETVVTMEVAPPRERFGTPGWIEQQAELLERVSALPRVRAASFATIAPMSRRDRGVLVDVPGFTARAENDRAVHLIAVSPTFLATYGATLLSGRTFTGQDRSNSARVAMINETAARFYFGEANPVGRKVRLTLAKSDYEIAGVVRDLKHHSLREEPVRMFYVPLAQPVDPVNRLALSVRCDGDAGAMTATVRRVLRDADAGLLITNESTLAARVDESLFVERMVSTVATLFGALALVLACVGLYGILSYSVSRRTNEIGIRMSLGANRGAVVRMVFRDALLLVAVGVALGAPAAGAVGRLAQSLLYGVKAADPLSIVGAAVLLALVGVASATMPARRASRVDPMAALRAE